jgi:hypothetical protein
MKHSFLTLKFTLRSLRDELLNLLRYLTKQRNLSRVDYDKQERIFVVGPFKGCFLFTTLQQLLFYTASRDRICEI